MGRTLGLPPIQLADWPTQDAMQWEAALGRGGFFDTVGALANRSERDRKQFRYSFGVWLAFLRQGADGRITESSLDRLDERHLRPFLRLLEDKLAPYSVLAILRDLLGAVRALSPARSFPMLEQVVRHVERTAKPSRDKRSRLRTPGELRHLGFKLMAEPQRGTARIRYSNRYLDGLAIVMLISMPLRIGNFGSLQIGTGIQRRGDRYWINVEGKHAKTGRPIEAPLPADLTQPIEHYLANHRAYLLAQCEQLPKVPEAAFWLSSWGTPLSSRLLAQRISQRTREAFGVSMNPHLFRDAAATTIAVEDPEHVGMIMPILGHSSLKVSEKHYNQAKTLESSRRYLSILEALRKGA